MPIPGFNRGYSLSEILIALAIILLFLALPIIAYTQFSTRSRDEKRKSDLLKLSQMIEQYKAEKGTYPPDLNTLVAEGYLPELPLDPRHGKLIPGESGLYYGYSYSTDGTTYTLTSRLEGSVSGSGGSGSGQLEGGMISGVFTGTGNGAVTGSFIITGFVSSGDLQSEFTGNVSGTGVAGTISGTLSGPVNGTISGKVTGSCTLTSGIATGGEFSGTYAACTLLPVVPDPEGPGIFIIRPRNLMGEEKPLARLTDEALTPSAVVPTKTPYLSPTPNQFLTGGPGAPDCTATPVCTGACVQPVNRCGRYSSTMGNCQYRTRPNFAVCNPKPAPDQPCTVTGDSCVNPEYPYCSGINCIPYCDISIQCSGSCQQIFNRCSSYSSTRSGCVYTAHTEGLACQVVPTLDQTCAINGDTCTSGTGEYPNCSGSTCIPNCDSGASCTGSCQETAGRCAPNSYASIRSGCTWRTYTGGTSCTPVTAPDQNCTITSQSCSSPSHCETGTSYCRSCITNSHCTDPNLPRCSSYSCTTCLSNQDCSRWPGRVCSAGTCKEPVYGRFLVNPARFNRNFDSSGAEYVAASKTDNSTYVQRTYSNSGDFVYYSGLYKLNPTGVLEWHVSSSEGTAMYGLYGRGVLATADGGAVTAYEYALSGSNRYRAVIEKFTATGGLVWRRVIGEPGVSDSRVGIWELSEIPPAQGGGYILAGSRSASSASSNRRGLLIRLDGDGAMVWQRFLGNGVYWVNINAAAYNPAGNTIVVVSSTGSSSASGNTIGGTGKGDQQIWRFDLSGNLLSVWTYGTSGTDFNWQASADIIGSDGSVLLPAGLNNYSFNVLLKLNPNNGLASSIVWNRWDYNYGPDTLNAFSDGSFAITRDGRNPGEHNAAAYDAGGSKLFERILKPVYNSSPVNCMNAPFDRQSNGQFVTTALCEGPQYVWKLDSGGGMAACSDLAADTYLAGYLQDSGQTVSTADVTALSHSQPGVLSFESPSIGYYYHSDFGSSCY